MFKCYFLVSKSAAHAKYNLRDHNDMFSLGLMPDGKAGFKIEVCVGDLVFV